MKNGIDRAADRTDRRQRFLVDVLPEHDAVHRVVHLLENVSDQKRPRESRNLLPHASLRQIDFTSSQIHPAPFPSDVL